MSLRIKAAFRKFAGILLWTGMFATAYTQSPLFTSNQNQYILHGMAKAGYGSLRGDWLANTLDPTPVFSMLVTVMYASLQQPAVFYVLCALLMGVYLFSFSGIAREFFSPPPLLFLAFFFIFHSAGLRYALGHTLGANWSYVFEDGFADQRMLGSVLQPSAFGVFLAASLFLYLKEHHYLAVLAAVLAAVIHPTYLISAAFLTLAYMSDAFWRQKRSKLAAGIGLLALLAVSPILIYVFTSFSGAGASPEEAAAARRLLVNVRIPHHAVVSWWFDATAILKLILIVTALYLVRRTRLFLLVLVPFLAGLLLTLVQTLLKSDFLALVFPWRISVLLVPLSTTILLAWAACKLVALQNQRMHAILRLAPPVLIALACFAGAIRFTLDLARKASAPERTLQNYIYTHPTSGDIYLTPVKMQDFRLAAGAPVYVDFKSIPYGARDGLEWDRRYRLADNFFKQPTCDALQRFGSQEGVTRLVLPVEQSLDCPILSLLYEDSYYRLYAIKE